MPICVLGRFHTNRHLEKPRDCVHKSLSTEIALGCILGWNVITVINDNLFDDNMKYIFMIN